MMDNRRCGPTNASTIGHSEPSSPRPFCTKKIGRIYYRYHEYQFLTRFHDKTYLIPLSSWLVDAVEPSAPYAETDTDTKQPSPTLYDRVLEGLSERVGIPAALLALSDASRRSLAADAATWTCEGRSCVCPCSASTSTSSSPTSTTITSVSVSFLNARLSPHISMLLGGKGGFGTLLKNQSKQSGAKVTQDFGACRDLNGRRLRHANDAAKIRLWKQQQERKRPDDDVDVAGWHLAIPNWAAAEMGSHKVRRRAEVAMRRELSAAREAENARRRTMEEKRAHRERAVEAYADSTYSYHDSDGDGNTMFDAIRHGMYAHGQKRRRLSTTKDDDNGGGGGGQWSLCTLSGEGSVLLAENSYNINNKRDEKQYGPTVRWRSDSNFASAMVIHDRDTLDHSSHPQPPCQPMERYEVELLEPIGKGGATYACQVGYACSEKFIPDDANGTGVGDDDGGVSFGYDPIRLRAFHGGREIAWGRPGTVVACALDHRGLSCSVDGVPLGPFPLETTTTTTTTMRPVVSLDRGQVVCLRLDPPFRYGDPREDALSTQQEQPHTATQARKRPLSSSLQEMDTTDNDGAPSEEKRAKEEKTIEGGINDSQSPKVMTTTTVVEDVNGTKAPTLTALSVSKPKPILTPVKVNLSEYATAEELAQKLGMDGLKSGLLALGVKCGGSLDERAARLFSLKGLERKDYPKKVRGKDFVV